MAAYISGSVIVKHLKDKRWLCFSSTPDISPCIVDMKGLVDTYFLVV